MKAVSIIFAIVLTVASIGIAVNASKYSNEARTELEEERYLRMVAEEDLDKATTKVSSLTSKLDSLQTKLKNVERLLDQTKASNKDLKTRIDREAKLKKDLELRIQELEKIASKVKAVPAAAVPTDG